MKTIRISVWKDNEYTWPQAYGFIPFLTGYFHEEESASARPCVLVVPGGGYYIASPTEASIVALDFYGRGYNTFVLTYTTNILSTTPLGHQPMQDLARAVRIVRSRSSEFGIHPDQIVTCGFSAGGHLTASEGVHFADIKDPDPQYQSVSARPDAMLLCYPVITSGMYTHSGSMTNLLGPDPAPDELEYMSLEKQVTENTPQSFLWQTATDECVPVENSYLFAAACKEHHVPFAHHVFSQGAHGLSVATQAWADGEYGKLYTLEPFEKTIAALKNGTAGVTVTEQKMKDLERVAPNHAPHAPSNRVPNPEAAVWTHLADQWMRTRFEIQ